jgi:hypothetical protein
MLQRTAAGRRPRIVAVFVAAMLFNALSARMLYAQTCSTDAQICANAVFCSGFEEGSKAIWDDYDGNPDSTNLLMTDGGPCNRSGNHVMRMRVPAGRGAADLVKVLPSAHDKLYARWYEKWEPGYDFAANNHGGGLFAGSRDFLGQSGIRPTGADFYTAWFEPLAGTWNGQNLTGIPHFYSYYRGMYQQCSDPNGNCFGDSLPCMYDEGSGFCTKAADRERIMPPRLQTGRWYCVEVLLDGGTPSSNGVGATGTQDFWIDDVEYGPWTNLWHRTTTNVKVDILYLSLFFHENHSVEGVMLDDVVVSTQKIGCHGSSTALPSAPTNLRIIPGEE